MLKKRKNNMMNQKTKQNKKTDNINKAKIDSLRIHRKVI